MSELLSPTERDLAERLSKQLVAKAKTALEPLRREMQIRKLDPGVQALQWAIVAEVAKAYGGRVE
jgi:hypothetical protein